MGICLRGRRLQRHLSTTRGSKGRSHSKKKKKWPSISERESIRCERHLQFDWNQILRVVIELIRCVIHPPRVGVTCQVQPRKLSLGSREGGVGCARGGWVEGGGRGRCHNYHNPTPLDATDATQYPPEEN